MVLKIIKLKRRWWNYINYLYIQIYIYIYIYIVISFYFEWLILLTKVQLVEFKRWYTIIIINLVSLNLFVTYPLCTTPLTTYYALVDRWCGPLGSINSLIYYNMNKPFNISYAYITTQRKESIMAIQHDEIIHSEFQYFDDFIQALMESLA